MSRRRQSDAYRSKGIHMKKAAVMFSALIVVALATGASAKKRDILVSFDGGIGVVPILSFASPVNTDGTFQNVQRNFVRGVRSSTLLWRIADLQADVQTNGQISVDGRGLLLAGGDSIGTTANLSVVATLICEAAAPFVELSSADTLDGIVWQGAIPLQADGDFHINDTLRGFGGIGSVPSECASPVLLIRSGGNGAWLAAGIPTADDRK